MVQGMHFVALLTRSIMVISALYPSLVRGRFVMKSMVYDEKRLQGIVIDLFNDCCYKKFRVIALAV